MKHYLLTWYGITDLRAALGFERGEGPIFGALRSGEFSDVVILAYSVPGKIAGVGFDRDSLSKEILEPARQAEVIDSLANTPDAHRLFEKWLKGRLKDEGLNVGVRICPSKLSALNDTRDIQRATNFALESVATEAGEKRITFYISPGTPVMAFTWAFVALTNPELDIRILASSQPSKPPEFIELPYELMAPSNRKLRVLSGDSETEFDVVFHLMGEQRMPVLLGVREFEARRHVFVTGGNYSSEVMKRFVPPGAWSEMHVNAFDPMAVKLALLKETATLPAGSKVGFNLTGGTKLMFAGAIAACRKIGGVPFYFETSQQRLIFLHDYTQRVPRGVDSCEPFLLLNDFDILTPGRWEDDPIRSKRKQLTGWLWRNRKIISRFYRQLSEINDTDGATFIPFNIRDKIYSRGCQEELLISLEKDGRAKLIAGQTQFNFAKCPDFAKYLCGGWLEEFVHLQLRELVDSGLLRDLRIGVEVTRRDRGEEYQTWPVQEFDGLMTDGKRLILVECKAGMVTADHLFKLQQLARNYGGQESHGVLIGAFPPRYKLVHDRILAARNIHGIFGRDVENGLTDLIRRILAPDR